VRSCISQVLDLSSTTPKDESSPTVRGTAFVPSAARPTIVDSSRLTNVLLNVQVVNFSKTTPEIEFKPSTLETKRGPLFAPFDEFNELISPCLKERQQSLSPLTKDDTFQPVFRPECNPDGTFRSWQCFTHVYFGKQCWCVDMNGEEIPGTRRVDGSHPDCKEGVLDR